MLDLLSWLWSGGCGRPPSARGLHGHRLVGFGNSTGLALARYLKARGRRGATCPDLWLSSRGAKHHYGKQAAAQRALAEQARLSLADGLACG